MRAALIIVSLIAIAQTVGVWFGTQRHERELQIAGGNYVLAAVVDGERRLFCCRGGEALQVVKTGESYHVELATPQEAKTFIEHGNAQQSSQQFRAIVAHTPIDADLNKRAVCLYWDRDSHRVGPAVFPNDAAMNWWISRRPELYWIACSHPEEPAP